MLPLLKSFRTFGAFYACVLYFLGRPNNIPESLLANGTIRSQHAYQQPDDERQCLYP